MALSTYSELKAAIADWLNRTDLTTPIVDFIALGEAHINRKLRTLDQLTVDTLSITAEAVNCPAGWVRTENIYLDSSADYEIEYVTPQRFLTEKQSRSASGKPVYFTVTGRQLRFVPAPDSTYTASHQYYIAVPALSDAAPTNWLLTRHPDVYLSASLRAANTYLRDMEGVAVATAALDAALEEIRLDDEKAKVATTPKARVKAI